MQQRKADDVRMFPPRTDDRGSMPMALLVITVVMVLSAAISPIVLRQITSTRSLEDRNTALNAAQAGMDVMMARVRAAAENSSGLLEDLPSCSLTGEAGAPGTPERLTYKVTIKYRDQNGTAFTECPPYSVPTTADVTAVGTSDNITRRLTATYVFRTNNTNIPGGQIKIAKSSLGDMCIDAGPDRSPAAGSQPTMQKCDGSSRQQFGYTEDLYLKLIYSEASGALDGMCLDASGATHTKASVVAFQPCPDPNADKRTPRFQWSLDGSSRFKSTNNSSVSENFCLAVLTPNTAGSKIGIPDCTTDDTKTVWRSGAGVGAGMAGDSTAQLVNYAQFSRCLDVTNKSTGSTYMIAWFCKQAPDGKVEWNQQWVHKVPTAPATSVKTNIIVTNGGVPYCLKSPLSTAAKIYVTVVECKDSTGNRNLPELLWTIFHNTGDYGTSYRIQDTKNFCLTPTDLNANPKDTHSDGTSKVKVATCSNSELQKWNAPPNINRPTPLTNLVEK